MVLILVLFPDPGSLSYLGSLFSLFVFLNVNMVPATPNTAKGSSVLPPSSLASLCGVTV
jgi:hypothetical protein